jgi:glycosyltransferase involved in cell wall biosynthesis
MVTAGRVRLAERAVRCFCAQTWPNKELVILDDGAEDYAPMLRRYERAAAIRYARVEREADRLLGGLRNLSVELARGSLCIQWDDDEWHHPSRIEAQLSPLRRGARASVLRHTLMHLDTPDFVAHPYRTGLRRGTPGTLLFPRTAIPYANVARGEDSDFLARLRRALPVAVLGPEFSHLFIRCFHGTNTWSRTHFSERLHYSMRDKVDYLIAKYVRGDVLTHPAFRLTHAERASASAFFAESRELGLCEHPC